MLTLGALVGRAELELAFAGGIDAARYEPAGVAGLTTLTLAQLLEGEPQRRLEPGSLVLVTGLPFRLRGHAEVALETLLEQLALDRCAGLVVNATPAPHQPFPQAIRDLSSALAVPLLVTTAPLREWVRTRHRFQESRLSGAERRAAQLATLVQQMPTQLADPRAMQRIADWLARALHVQVLVSEPQRVLAASPATAAETLAPAIIHRSVGAATPEQHTRLITLAPAHGADTVLAVARTAPFDDADVRLLGQTAKLLGLLDQARREYRAAADASRAARRAAVELLLDAEVDKARRVMAPQAPGLLEPETARVFVIETPRTHRDAAARRCEAVTAGRALVIADPRAERRILVVQPIQVPARAAGPGSAVASDAYDTSGAGGTAALPGGSAGAFDLPGTSGVPAELARVVAALGADATLSGSGIYSMSLLADALKEAVAAQRFALHQPDALALSAHHTDLVGLLPPRDAQRWARNLLDPLMRHETQWEQMRETLASALAHPYTVAARRLHLHRNTVTRRVTRAAEALDVDFGTVADRIAVGLALELVTQREHPAGSATLDGAPPTLPALLAAPQVLAWADTLLHTARGDRRDLLTTATVWLTHDAHIEPTARALGLSEATVRSHLRALERHMARDFSSLNGLRDLQFSLHVVTGDLDVADSRGVLCPAT
ncbi:PucR family transcriptional regulator [Streptomyces aureoverticillatus]|uniref:PucR family transcriptional regulator n=1 Tax=Streptomyces aureoverticillatus TaxID=66871 RepID=UPI0013D97B56|nr:PucR family transcriptional regulator [Streptomyces aureoverticillatus]QIB48024.1 PucR family transcriptional regulator [Streptomyces aureoverticillatus]